MIVPGLARARVDEWSLTDSDVLELSAVARRHLAAGVADRIEEALASSTSTDRALARRWCAGLTNLVRAGVALRGDPHPVVATGEQLAELAELADDYGQVDVARVARRAVAGAVVGSSREAWSPLAALISLLSHARADLGFESPRVVELTGAEIAEAVVEYAARRGVLVRGHAVVAVVRTGPAAELGVGQVEHASATALSARIHGDLVADRRSDAARTATTTTPTRAAPR